MTTATEWNEHTPENYRKAVDHNLWTLRGVTIADLHADTAVRAAKLAGLSPFECYRWLVRVDGLN